jgi:uncharacterized RDD family membrane protein YckC
MSNFNQSSAPTGYPADSLAFSGDQLSIETPEQVDLRFPIAGVGSRMIALFLDQVLQALVYLLIGIVAYVTLGSSPRPVPGHATPAHQNWLLAAFLLLNFILLDGYFVLFEAFWNGQTPGKRVMKLRVLKASGRSITLFESLTRNLLRVVDYFPGVYVVGLVTMACNRQNMRLGDLAAGTIVVHERSDEQPFLSHTSRTFTAASTPPPVQDLTPAARAAWTANDAVLPADRIARLTSADLHVIETFFTRALDLTVEKREELGSRVAATMCARMNFERPATLGAEQMLELIAYKMRMTTRS